MSQLAFGSASGLGAGDACGRCFALTGTADPYSPAFTGPFGQSVVVKVTDLCPAPENEQWCGQTTSNPVNQFGAPVQCVLAFFPPPFFLPLFLFSTRDSGLRESFWENLRS